MTLDEVNDVAACFEGVATRPVFAASSELASFRQSAAAALSSGHPIAVNFLRTGLDQLGGGHWSPVVAFSAENDRFLLLDVSRYKYPPVWVTAEQMFTAMNTVDGTSNKSRGWIEIYARSK